VTIVEIPREIDRFVLYFDTERREVNAYALATSLIGLADAIREANALVNPGYSVEVVVEAMADGSFQAIIRTVFEKAKNLFSNEMAKAIVYGIISTHIYETVIKKEAPPSITINDNSVIIKAGTETIIVPRDVYEAKRQLDRSERFNTAIDQVIQGAAADPAVKGIGLKSEPSPGRPPLYVPREQFAVFDSRSSLEHGDREIIEFANLEISRAILQRGKRRWEFFWRGIRIAAPVLDDRFFDKFFAHEIMIAPGDGLRVVLRITQTADKDTGIYINSSYEVVEVLEHIPRLQQGRLSSSPL
jgi:hypothetical protein